MSICEKRSSTKRVLTISMNAGPSLFYETILLSTHFRENRRQDTNYCKTFVAYGHQTKPSQQFLLSKNWHVHVKHFKALLLKYATKKAVPARDLISKHICKGDLHACTWLANVDKTVMNLILGTSFTDRCICGNFPTEWNVAAVQSLPMAKLSIYRWSCHFSMRMAETTRTLKARKLQRYCPFVWHAPKTCNSTRTALLQPPFQLLGPYW